MLQVNELILLFTGLGALVFILLNRARLRKIPVLTRLLYGFYFLLAAWVFTVAEGFIWPETLNLLEHICYLASAALILAWCVEVARKDRRP